MNLDFPSNDGNMLSKHKLFKIANLYPESIEKDLKSNNTYRSRSLSEIKKFLLQTKEYEQESLIDILLFVTDINQFLNLLPYKYRLLIDEMIDNNESYVEDFLDFL